MKTENIFQKIPGELPEELLEEILSSPAKSIRIERIVSHGHASPQDGWYDQLQSEWVIVLKGQAGLRIEDEAEVLDLEAGDYVLIPPHCRHRVEWTADDQDTVWLAIHIT